MAKKVLTRAQITQQMAQLAAQLKQIDAADAEQERKDDTRRKILAGGIVLNLAAQGELITKDFLLKILDDNLTRDDDRKLFNKLFGLAPLPKADPVKADPVKAALPVVPPAPSVPPLAAAPMNGAHPATGNAAASHPSQNGGRASLVKKNATLQSALPLDSETAQ